MDGGNVHRMIEADVLLDACVRQFKLASNNLDPFFVTSQTWQLFAFQNEEVHGIDDDSSDKTITGKVGPPQRFERLQVWLCGFGQISFILS